MSKPVFQDIFKWSGRRNRQSYILIQLASWLAIGLIAFIGIGLIAIVGDHALIQGAIFVAMVVGLIATIWAAWATSAQRIRDIGHSGVWVLLQLLPYVGFVVALGIMIMPGDTLVDNRYGPTLLKNNTQSLDT